MIPLPSQEVHGIEVGWLPSGDPNATASYMPVPLQLGQVIIIESQLPHLIGIRARSAEQFGHLTDDMEQDMTPEP
jgi:hypothetical protein